MLLSILILIVGILAFVLGCMVRKYKISNRVVWVDLNKYDNDKVADIMGCHIMLLGICLIAIARVNYVLIDAYQSIVIVTVILLTIAIELSGYYQIYKYAKLEV